MIGGSPKHLVEIEDMGWVLDVLGERFDSLHEMLTPESYIYGSALSDIIAGEAVSNNACIVVSSNEYGMLIDNFEMSVKWVKKGFKAPSIKTSFNEGAQPEMKKRNTFGSSYQPKRGNKVDEYISLDNMRALIVSVPYNPGRCEESPYDYVRPKILFKKQCLCIDHNGKVFELVEGAYKDCVDKIVSINSVDMVNNLKAIRSAVDRLIQRGWTSEVNYRKVSKTLKRREKLNQENKKGCEWLSAPMDLKKHMRKSGHDGFYKPGMTKKIRDVMKVIIDSKNKRILDFFSKSIFNTNSLNKAIGKYSIACDVNRVSNSVIEITTLRSWKDINTLFSVYCRSKEKNYLDLARKIGIVFEGPNQQAKPFASKIGDGNKNLREIQVDSVPGEEWTVEKAIGVIEDVIEEDEDIEALPEAANSDFGEISQKKYTSIMTKARQMGKPNRMLESILDEGEKTKTLPTNDDILAKKTKSVVRKAKIKAKKRKIKKQPDGMMRMLEDVKKEAKMEGKKVYDKITRKPKKKIVRRR